MKKLTFVLDLYFSKICLWTDSTVLLVWIGAPLTEWKIVLANSFRGPRYDISIIWYHISSHNSADVFSRGTLHRHPQWQRRSSWPWLQASWEKTTELKCRQLPEPRECNSHLYDDCYYGRLHIKTLIITHIAESNCVLSPVYPLLWSRSQDHQCLIEKNFGFAEWAVILSVQRNHDQT